MTPKEREAEQIRQSLARLAPNGFKVYEHGNEGWFFDTDYVYDEDSHGPYDDAEDALKAAIEWDNYDPTPTESESYDYGAEREMERTIEVMRLKR